MWLSYALCGRAFSSFDNDTRVCWAQVRDLKLDNVIVVDGSVLASRKSICQYTCLPTKELIECGIIKKQQTFGAILHSEIIAWVHCVSSMEISSVRAQEFGTTTNITRFLDRYQVGLTFENDILFVVVNLFQKCATVICSVDCQLCCYTGMNY